MLFRSHAARGREKIRFVRIIVIAGTQPDHGRLTALLYIVSRAQKKLNRFLKAGGAKAAQLPPSGHG